MLVKDQLRVRMDQLSIPTTELARRVGVSGQSVRHWLAGRSFPSKSKCHLLEEALSFKLDFSEGESMQSITVEQTIKQTSVNTLLAISRLPADVQLLIAKLAQAYVALLPNPLQQHTLDEPARQTSAPSTPVAPAERTPPRPANHGRATSRVIRGKPVAVKTTK